MVEFLPMPELGLFGVGTFCSYEFLPTPELELFVVEFLPTPELGLFGVGIFIDIRVGIIRGWNFHWFQSQEYYKRIIIANECLAI